jgi:phosphoserine phosphatase RsbU/P
VPPISKTHIFVVEDSPIFQQLLEEALRAGSYDNVTFAGSGEEALAILGVAGNDAPTITEPDAILLDIMMPGIDGIDTCARIRADGRYQYTPILMVTAEAEMESLAQAFVAGANDYVRKPFNSIELLARLRSSLRLKSEIERRREREQELLAMTREIRRSPNTGTLFDGVSLIPGPPFVNAFFAALPATRLEDMGVLAVQIDGFPTPATPQNGTANNDRYSRIGALLADVPARLGEVLARYESGTYIAVVLAASPQELVRRAETVRQASLFFGQKSHADKGVTLSIGAVHGSAVANSEPRTLLAKAVFAMERAALGGGDCVVLQND